MSHQPENLLDRRDRTHGHALYITLSTREWRAIAAASTGPSLATWARAALLAQARAAELSKQSTTKTP